MDDRAWQLIKLLNDKNYTTAAQLAEQIGVSGKTIRNRLKLLSEELEMHGAELESCTGYGYRLHIVDSQKYKAWKAGQTELLWSEHLPESVSPSCWSCCCKRTITSSWMTYARSCMYPATHWALISGKFGRSCKAVTFG